MCFGIHLLISFVLLSFSEAFILQERTTGQYVVGTSKKKLDGTALELTPEMEMATKFKFGKVPNVPNGLFITTEAENKAFDYADAGGPAWVIHLYPFHGRGNQQFMVVRDGDGYYQIVFLVDPKNTVRYDKESKELVSGVFVPGNGFKIIELKTE